MTCTVGVVNTDPTAASSVPVLCLSTAEPLIANSPNGKNLSTTGRFLWVQIDCYAFKMTSE